MSEKSLRTGQPAYLVGSLHSGVRRRRPPFVFFLLQKCQAHAIVLEHILLYNDYAWLAAGKLDERYRIRHCGGEIRDFVSCVVLAVAVDAANFAERREGDQVVTKW